GENGNFYFANPTGCLPGTPVENCFSEATHPGGLLLAGNAFFHPHFELVTSELRELPVLRPIPPCQPVGLASGAAVAVAGVIYHIGGFDGTSVSRAVQIYSPATNRWQQGPPMLRGVEAAQAAVVGSLLYVFGGRDPDQQLSLDTGQALDTSSGFWSSVKTMPLAVSGGAATAAGRKIYVIGGWTNDAGGRPVLTNRLQIYDTDSESWSEGAPAPLAVAGAGAVTVASEIYLINGRTDAGVSNGVYIYNTATGAWRSGPPTLQGVYEAAAGLAGNRIYLAGGRRALDEPADRQRMQILDLLQNRWHQGHEMPVPTAGSGAVVIDGKFFVLGGRIRAGAGASAGAVTDAIQQYDPALGWTLCDSHPFFTSADVLNAASGAAGPAELSPGSRAVILGYNFTTIAQTAPPVRFDNGVFTSDLPTELNGISISIDGAPASLVSVSPDRVEFQVPHSVAGGQRRPVSLQLIQQGAAAQHPPVQVTLLEAAPAIYVYNYGEYRETVYLERATAVARHSDGKLIHPSNPARPGETVSILMTGLGPVVPPLASGQRAASDPLPQVELLPEVIIGGREAEVVAATAAPREAGLYEVRAVVPPQTPPSNAVPVEVIVNGVRSNTAVLSVR
ncbi:MAG: hypothetical protein HYX74_10780, partial [Acidobacteria bacterium]|nr:hypothetical protein [Acidobacteriota bacterium]